ncbi:MAG: hypothetical protein K5787_01720 [Lentisphaeria bacterium]|nr:hypothetical protein [Lentisphaeria bacterium]
MKKNPRYEKVSLDEIKSDCHFKDISDQNFLDEFIKKFGIDIKINYYVDNFLKRCSERRNSILKRGEEIEYFVGIYDVDVTVPILDANNSVVCSYNMEFNKNTGKITDDWIDAW